MELSKAPLICHTGASLTCQSPNPLPPAPAARLHCLVTQCSTTLPHTVSVPGSPIRPWLPHQAFANTLHCPAAPLELDNGEDMIDLVCMSYATPSEELEGVDRKADDAREDYDFSKPWCCCVAPACYALARIFCCS